MPLFAIKANNIESVPSTNFALESQLHNLVEKNVGVIFNCRFVASEFMTGAKHGGRIDTLALSEENNPVIIEYKKVESSELINQSLFYLAWIQDHRGDFELAVQRQLGPGIKVDWSDIRVICLAPGYRKYDLLAVEVMGAKIELWRYRLFANEHLYLEEVFSQSGESSPVVDGKDPKMVEAGKKAAITRATASYTIDQHLDGKSEAIRSLAMATREFILGLDETIEEAPKKNYIAYKTTQNIVCMEVRKSLLSLFLKLSPRDVADPPGIYSDVTNIGHHGTGDAEFKIHNESDLEIAKPYIEQSYHQVGG